MYTILFAAECSLFLMAAIVSSITQQSLGQGPSLSQGVAFLSWGAVFITVILIFIFSRLQLSLLGWTMQIVFLGYSVRRMWSY